MEEMAAYGTTLGHTNDLGKFHVEYSHYASVRFIRLHFPLVETIASHMGLDNSP